MPTEEEVGHQDAEALARQQAKQARRSAELAAGYAERIGTVATEAALRELGRELTGAVKRGLAALDLARVRVAYGKRLAELKAKGNGEAALAPAAQEGAKTVPRCRDSAGGPAWGLLSLIERFRAVGLPHAAWANVGSPCTGAGCSAPWSWLARSCKIVYQAEVLQPP